MSEQLVAKRKDPPVLLRVPKEVLKLLNTAAAKGGRSRNSEIVLRLKKSLQEAPVLAEAAK